MKLIIQVSPYELDWSQIVYVPITVPFEPFEAEEYGDELAVSVLLEDLIRSTESENVIGINLKGIIQRHGTEAGLLIIELDDVEDVLGFEPGYFRNTNLL
ncbi:hypothetical protein D3C78_1779050 [compost metagenome]